jgi:xanthine dehydrogenase large subunit
VAATSFAAAQRAALLAKIDYEELPAQLTVEDSLAAQSFVLPQHQLLLGDPDAKIQSAPHQLSGEIYMRGQEHFYL